MESFAADGSTIVGADPDIGKALGEVMGVPLNFVNANFDSILPGLSSGKYDLGMSAFTDTKDRQKVVDFVTYLTAGTGFYTKASGGTSVNGLSDLCGHSIAAEKGTTQQIDATAQDKKCKAAGKPGVNVTVFPDQNGANLAISSGRAEIGMADSPVAEYIVEQSNGQFKVDRQRLQHRPVRDRDGEGERPHEAGSGGAEGDHRQRHLREDPQEVRHREGRNRQPADKRRDQLAQRAEADGLNRDNRSARATGAA